MHIEAWDEHRGELLHFVANRIPDAHEAHHIVQKVFLRAMRLENGLCGIDNRRAWLFQVTSVLP